MLADCVSRFWFFRATDADKVALTAVGHLPMWGRRPSAPSAAGSVRRGRLIARHTWSVGARELKSLRLRENDRVVADVSECLAEVVGLL